MLDSELGPGYLMYNCNPLEPWPHMLLTTQLNPQKFYYFRVGLPHRWCCPFLLMFFQDQVSHSLALQNPTLWKSRIHPTLPCPKSQTIQVTTWTTRLLNVLVKSKTHKLATRISLFCRSKRLNSQQEVLNSNGLTRPARKLRWLVQSKRPVNHSRPQGHNWSRSSHQQRWAYG